MKKYLVLGKSNIINHYCDDKSDVTICDYAKEYYNLKSFIKNNEQFKDNIILYKELLDEEKFCNILKKHKPQNIIVDINIYKDRLSSYLVSNDTNIDLISYFKMIFDGINTIKNVNVILISSCDVYNSSRNIIISEKEKIRASKVNYINNLINIENLFLKYNFNKIILRVPLLLGYGLENSFIERKISQVYKGHISYDSDIPFYNFIDVSFLWKAVVNSVNYMDDKKDVSEVINVVNSKCINRNKLVRKIISYTECEKAYKDCHYKLPRNNDKNDLFNTNYRLFNNHKMKNMLGLIENTDIDDSLKETLLWYNNSHLLNQKLTIEIKKEFESYKDAIKRAEYIMKYQENELTNLDIINYFRNNKNVSANKLSDTYKDLDLDSLINLKTDIIKYLRQFKNKKVKKFPNGIKYQKTHNKVTTFLYEDILTENDKKYFENQLNELEKLITKNNLE